MLPFQNIHSGLNGGWHGTHERREKESDGGRRRRRRVWPWKSPPGGAVKGQQGAPTLHTKLALCEISGGHQEGPTALFSQSEPVCFL